MGELYTELGSQAEKGASSEVEDEEELIVFGGGGVLDRGRLNLLSFGHINFLLCLIKSLLHCCILIDNCCL